MNNQKICMTCGATGFPVSVIKGAFGTELLLWLFFLVPGLIYSIWRSTTRCMACPSCGSTQIVPLSTPMGMKMWEEARRQKIGTVV